jgi:hypothetical protein
MMASDVLEKAYAEMCIASMKYGENPTELTRLYYEAKVNNYRDLCTLIVEWLQQNNPNVLEDIVLWE